MISEIEETLRFVSNDRIKGEPSWDTVDEAAIEYISHVEYLLSRLKEYEELERVTTVFVNTAYKHDPLIDFVSVPSWRFDKIIKELNKLQEK